jgi:hypothetical protein
VKGALVDTGPAWLRDQRKPVATDELGEYALRNCEAGSQIVTAQAEGFAPDFREVRLPTEERWRRLSSDLESRAPSV